MIAGIALFLITILSVNAQGLYYWAVPNSIGGYNVYGSDGYCGYSTPNSVGGYIYVVVNPGKSHSSGVLPLGKRDGAEADATTTPRAVDQHL
jgi:hypothetical protein